MAVDTVAKERMAALANHPGWPELVSYYRDKYDEKARSLGYQLLGGADLDAVEIARTQGQWRAIKTLIDTPQAFESMLRFEEGT
jgi:hypothetical protein